MALLWMLPVAAVMTWLMWQFIAGLRGIEPKGGPADMQDRMAPPDNPGV